MCSETQPDVASARTQGGYGGGGGAAGRDTGSGRQGSSGEGRQPRDEFSWLKGPAGRRADRQPLETPPEELSETSGGPSPQPRTMGKVGGPMRITPTPREQDGQCSVPGGETSRQTKLRDRGPAHKTLILDVDAWFPDTQNATLLELLRGINIFLLPWGFKPAWIVQLHMSSFAVVKINKRYKKTQHWVSIGVSGGEKRVSGRKRDNTKLTTFLPKENTVLLMDHHC
ncbi:unnamed protein product [Lepidochelys olivacea]